VWQKRLAKLGIEPNLVNGYGCFYTFSLETFLFGIRKRRQLTDEQKQAIGERLAAYRDGGETDDEDDAD